MITMNVFRYLDKTGALLRQNVFQCDEIDYALPIAVSGDSSKYF